MKNVGIKEFKKAVNILAKGKEDFFFNHYGSEQGAIVIGTIFKYANSTVRMFVGDLNGDLSENEYYLENLKKYILRGGELKVLIQDIDNLNPSSAFKLIDMYSGMKDNVEIFPTNAKLLHPETKKEFHFTTGDDLMFRVEDDINEYSGYSSFNAPDIVKILSSGFDNIFEEEKKRHHIQ